MRHLCCFKFVSTPTLRNRVWPAGALLAASLVAQAVFALDPARTPAQYADDAWGNQSRSFALLVVVMVLAMIAAAIWAAVALRTRHIRREAARSAEMERQLLVAERMEALGQLASGIAHDFNNTLMAVYPWAEIIQEQYSHDPLLQQAAESICLAVERAKKMTSQLLELAQPKPPEVAPVETAPGKGTTFNVLLPKAEPQLAPAQVPLASVAPGALLGKKVLLIDDEAVFGVIIRHALELEGIVVEIASTGPEALARLEEGFHPDLVILDLGLPEMSGERVHAMLRKQWTDLPIIISSGYGDRTRLEPLMGDGKTSYIQKPYPMNVLTRQIATMTQR